MQERKGTHVVGEYLHDLSILKNVRWRNKITIDLQFQTIRYPQSLVQLLWYNR